MALSSKQLRFLEEMSKVEEYLIAVTKALIEESQHLLKTMYKGQQ